MAWSKSLNQNFKLEREKQQQAEKAQQAEKKQNTFYGDYKSRQQSAAQTSQENTLQRAVSENPFTPVKTKVYQSYDDRKKTGNVFIPNTVLGQNRSGADNISTVIPNVTLSTEKKLGELMRDYEMQISESSTPSERQRRIQNVMNRHKDVFDEYKRQTGADLTIPGLQHMYEQYADKTVKQMQKGKNGDAENLRPATLKDLTVNSFMRGFANSKLGVENEKAMRGAPNKAAEYKKYLEQDKYQFAPKNWLEKAVSGAIGQAGQMVEGVPEAAAYGGTMAAMAAIAGNAGPQAAIPEEVLSVPSAFGTGYAVGSGMHAYKVEAGLAYDEMIDNGISSDTAAGIAAGVGGVNAALEAVQLDDLIKSFDVLSKSKGTKGAAKRLGEYILKRGGHIASETAQEVGQELVTIGGVQAANKIDKGEWAYNTDEVIDRAKDTMASSALTFAAMGAGGDFSHIANRAAGAAIDNYHNTVNTGREFKGMGSDVVQSVIDTGKESDNNTSAYKYADKLQSKQTSGKDLSDWNVGRQWQKNVKAIQRENEFAAAMSNIKPTEITDRLYSDSGQELNGVATSTGIKVSSNGSQSVPMTIKHEWSHMFKNLDPTAYNEYEASVIKAARETNNEAVDRRIKHLTEEYGYSREVAREEIVAELTGGFNTMAIQQMAEGNTTLANKMALAAGKAKSHIKAAFSGGKYTNPAGVQLTFEQLNNAEKQYVKGLDAARNNAVQTDTVKYSPIEYDNEGKAYVNIKENQGLFAKADKTDYAKIASEFMNKEYRNTILPLSEYNLIYLNKTGINKYNHSGIKYDADMSEAKSRAGVELHNLLEASEYIGSSDDSKNHKFADYGFEYYKTRFVVDGQMFEGIIDVGVSDKGATFYGMSNIKRVSFEDGKPSALLSDVTSALKKETPYISSISNSDENVKYSVKENAADRITNDIIKENGSAIKKNEIADDVRTLYELLTDGDVTDERYRTAWSIAENIGQRVAQGIQITDSEIYDNYKDLRNTLRNTPISISDADKSDITGADNFNEFRRKNFGSLSITKDGTRIDKFYQELSELYPNFFDAQRETHPADQLMQIEKVLEDIKPKSHGLSDTEINEAAGDIAGKLITDIINNPSVKVNDSQYNDWDSLMTSEEAKRQEKLQSREYEKEFLKGQQHKWKQQKYEEMTQEEYSFYKDIVASNNKIDEVLEKLSKGGVPESVINKIRKAHNTDVRTGYLEQRREAADREKLLRLAREINKMKLSPENQAKIPAILNHIDTMGINILEHGYTRKDGVEVMGRIELSELRDKYYEIKSNNPDFLPDPKLEAKIGRLSGMEIGKMDIGDVRELVQTLQQVKHEIQTNNKLLNDERNREISETAHQVRKEVRASKGVNYLRSTSKFLDNYNTMQLSAVREFRRLSGYAKNGALEGLANDLNDGQRKSIEFRKQVEDKFSSFAKDKKNMERLLGKKAEMIDISKYDIEGRKLYITPAMRISLYLHSKNNDNLRHIANGGITVPNMELYRKDKFDDAYNMGETVRLKPSQVREIAEGMTDFERRFAEVVHEVFNGDMRTAINETSLMLDGYERAVVGEYFPIATDRHFTNREFEGVIRDKTLEGNGALKERQQGATNPVMLEDVTAVLSRQTKWVADYYGLAIPIRNFDRVYKSTSRGYSTSTSKVIAEKWGKTAEKYIENLITDLQGGRSGNYDIFDSIRGKFAQATLAVNPGVMLKQAASYPTAGAVLGYKALSKALTQKVTQADIENCYKYTPLLWYRSQGYSISEIGDWASRSNEDWSKNMPAVMGWIQKFDVMTTTKLWKAAEIYVEDNFRDLEKGNDAFYKKTAEIYNKTIEETQPNYTVMQRPDILRSDSKMVKAVTMFKTQIMQNYNILYDAYGEYNARLKDYKANQTDETRSDLKKAKANLARAVSSQVIAAATIAAINMLASVLKGKFKRKYGDEDEKVTPESVSEAALFDMANTLMGTFLGGGELISIVEACFGKGKWYDIEAPALTTINDLCNGIINMAQIDDKGDIRQWIKPINNLAKSLCMMGGIPLSNVESYGTGIINNIVRAIDDTGRIALGFIDGNAWEYKKQKLLTELNEDTAKKFYPRLNSAREHIEHLKQNGADEKNIDRAQETYDRIYNDLLDTGIDEDTIKDKIPTEYSQYAEEKAAYEKAEKTGFGRELVSGEIGLEKELERLEEWNDSISYNASKGEFTIKYGHDTYLLTAEQVKRYDNNTKKRITAYQSALADGGKIEDVLGECNVALYADEMTEEQYNYFLEKANKNANKNFKKAESRDEAIASRDNFVNGETTRPVTLTGKYTDLPERVQTIVMSKATTKATNDVKDAMEAEIKYGGKKVLTDPSHARNKEPMSDKEETQVSSANTEAQTQKKFTTARASGHKSGGGKRGSGSRKSSSGGGKSDVHFTRAMANSAARRNNRVQSIASLPNSVKNNVHFTGGTAKGAKLPNTVRFIPNPITM